MKTKHFLPIGFTILLCAALIGVCSVLFAEQAIDNERLATQNDSGENPIRETSAPGFPLDWTEYGTRAIDVGTSYDGIRKEIMLIGQDKKSLYVKNKLSPSFYLATQSPFGDQLEKIDGFVAGYGTAAWFVANTGKIQMVLRIPRPGYIYNWGDYSKGRYARDIATAPRIDNKDVIFMIHSSGRYIYRYNTDDHKWDYTCYVPYYYGRAVAMDVAHGSYYGQAIPVLWIVTEKGYLYKFTVYPSGYVSRQNMTKSLPSVRDVGVQPTVNTNPVIYVIAGSYQTICGYHIYTWSDFYQDWRRITNGLANRVSVDYDGNAWVINSEKKVFRGVANPYYK